MMTRKGKKENGSTAQSAHEMMIKLILEKKRQRRRTTATKCMIQDLFSCSCSSLLLIISQATQKWKNGKFGLLFLLLSFAKVNSQICLRFASKKRQSLWARWLERRFHHLFHHHLLLLLHLQFSADRLQSWLPKCVWLCGSSHHMLRLMSNVISVYK